MKKLYTHCGIVDHLKAGLKPITTNVEKEYKKYIEAFRSLPKEPQRKVVLLKKRKR